MIKLWMTELKCDDGDVLVVWVFHAFVVYACMDCSCARGVDTARFSCEKPAETTFSQKQPNKHRITPATQLHPNAANTHHSDIRITQAAERNISISTTEKQPHITTILIVSLQHMVC